MQIDDDYVRNYIAQVNTELQTKILEVCSLKAQLQVANATIDKLKKVDGEYSSNTKEVKK